MPDHRTNLIPARTSFVGRDSELATVDERFTHGARLVTLVGLGGVGKTRIAHRYGLQLVERRLAEPGQRSSVDDLYEAGWPDPPIARPSAVHRVHVTLSELRKLGLQALLLTRDDGWLLDPGAEVEVAGSAAGGGGGVGRTRPAGLAPARGRDAS